MANLQYHPRDWFTVQSVVLVTVLTLAMIGWSSASRPVVRSTLVSIRNRVTACAFTSTSKSGGSSSIYKGMAELPSNVVKYSQVPKGENKVFTSTTIPKGLLKEHSTKAGTWGVIQVRQGTLQYQIPNKDKPDVGAQIFDLVAPTFGVIEPTVLHQVKPLTDNVEFVVEFYRIPGTGPVDEKREGL